MTPTKKITKKATSKKQPKAKKVAVKKAKAPAKSKVKSVAASAPAADANASTKSPTLKSFSGNYIHAIGRRKTSVAEVRLYKAAGGSASLVVNGVEAKSYFPAGGFIELVMAPLVKSNTNIYAISCKVKGGGVRGQAEAIRLAISRAMVSEQEGFRKEFKDAGYLTRDPRMKERKKYGLKKARRAAQWSKR